MKKFIPLVLLALIASGFYGYTRWSAPAVAGAQMDATDASKESTVHNFTPERRVPPEGMLEFHSDPNKFSLFHPEGMRVRMEEEGQGAATFTFEDEVQSRGFQIFVVPFIEAQVSEERFRMDIPSGVRRDMKDITIDGAMGASFFSEHAHLGETAEVWFVYDGYLYEVTTLKGLEGWLSEILATWEFVRV